MITATRFHDVSIGHRVYKHESKCKHLHGHNYRVHFTVSGELDAVGRVLDFGVIKEKLCMWLEDCWDHRMLIWEDDPWLHHLLDIDGWVVPVPFNPTAENMAQYLLNVVGPKQLEGTGTVLLAVQVEETRKCSATAAVPLSPT